MLEGAAARRRELRRHRSPRARRSRRRCGEGIRRRVGEWPRTPCRAGASSPADRAHQGIPRPRAQSFLLPSQADGVDVHLRARASRERRAIDGPRGRATDCPSSAGRLVTARVLRRRDAAPRRARAGARLDRPRHARARARPRHARVDSPFFERHTVVVDSPHDGAPPVGSTPRRQRARGPERDPRAARPPREPRADAIYEAIRRLRGARRRADPLAGRCALLLVGRRACSPPSVKKASSRRVGRRAPRHAQQRQGDPPRDVEQGRDRLRSLRALASRAAALARRLPASPPFSGRLRSERRRGYRSADNDDRAPRGKRDARVAACWTWACDGSERRRGARRKHRPRPGGRAGPRHASDHGARRDHRGRRRFKPKRSRKRCETRSKRRPDGRSGPATTRSRCSRSK